MSAAETLRVAQAADLAPLADLIIGFRDQLQADGPSHEALLSYLPHALDDPDLEFGLACPDHGPAIGYTQTRFFRSIWVLGDEAHLEDLFVIEAARGRGLGTRLLEFAFQRARFRGARSIGLITNEHNAAAQTLYRSLGFEPKTERAWGAGREVHWGKRL